jgi:hypothetical protein
MIGYECCYINKSKKISNKLIIILKHEKPNTSCICCVSSNVDVLFRYYQIQDKYIRRRLYMNLIKQGIQQQTKTMKVYYLNKT